MRLLKMPLIPIIIAMLQVPAADESAVNHEVTRLLAEYTASEVPGLQYIVVDAEGILFEFADGFADIQNQKTMTLDTTLCVLNDQTYTAIAILQLAEQGKIRLEDPIDLHLPNHLYGGHGITIRHLLAHTAGLPNPIPLRWVHLAEQSAAFDEDAALAQVAAENPRLSFEPGRKYAYSNIGYWLLGKIVERVSGQSYTDYVRTNIIQPLGLSSQEMDFVIPDPARHAKGYLAKYSLMNLMKGLVTDSKFWGGYEGNWLRLRSHHLNGPAFGGLVGTARSFARLLQDQLRTKSVLLSPETKRLLETQQTDGRGKKIPMTLGWHVGDLNGTVYFFKEGGGGGFHSEMRLYPAKGIASVTMVNSTVFNSTKFLNRVDRKFLGEN
jgi:CubicO group peptidase (beta-lactamase class C family)